MLPLIPTAAKMPAERPTAEMLAPGMGMLVVVRIASSAPRMNAPRRF
jgi:hypothetical protein